MNEEEKIEEYMTQLLGFSGAARSCYIQAIDAYPKHDGTYEEFLKEADENFRLAHDQHSNLLLSSAAENKETLMLLMHAEDQLMCAETFRIIAGRIALLFK